MVQIEGGIRLYIDLFIIIFLRFWSKHYIFFKENQRCGSCVYIETRRYTIFVCIKLSLGNILKLFPYNKHLSISHVHWTSFHKTRGLNTTSNWISEANGFDTQINTAFISITEVYLQKNVFYIYVKVVLLWMTLWSYSS